MRPPPTAGAERGRLLDAADERPRARARSTSAPNARRRSTIWPAVSADLCRLPAPSRRRTLLGPHRGARGRGQLAEQAGSATAPILAVGAGLFAWMAALATWGLYRLLAGSGRWLEWLVLTTVPASWRPGAVGGYVRFPPPSERSLIMTPVSQRTRVIPITAWVIAPSFLWRCSLLMIWIIPWEGNVPLVVRILIPVIPPFARRDGRLLAAMSTATPAAAHALRDGTLRRFSSPTPSE